MSTMRPAFHHVSGCTPSDVLVTCSTSNPMMTRSALGASFMGRIQGNMIPFGALVYFKPSDARSREQQHKFDPMGIPGVLAGYSLGPGLHWSRKYRVWALCDWTKQKPSI